MLSPYRPTSRTSKPSCQQWTSLERSSRDSRSSWSTRITMSKPIFTSQSRCILLMTNQPFSFRPLELFKLTWSEAMGIHSRAISTTCKCTSGKWSNCRPTSLPRLTTSRLNLNFTLGFRLQRQSWWVSRWSCTSQRPMSTSPRKTTWGTKSSTGLTQPCTSTNNSGRTASPSHQSKPSRNTTNSCHQWLCSRASSPHSATTSSSSKQCWNLKWNLPNVWYTSWC